MKIKNKKSGPDPTNQEQKPDIKNLTQRELEVLKYLRRGLKSIEIANALGISRRTAEVHRYNILKKLGLKDMVSLIRLFMKQ